VDLHLISTHIENEHRLLGGVAQVGEPRQHAANHRLCAPAGRAGRQASEQ